MTLLNNYFISTEAIGFQNNEALNTDLVRAIDKFRSGKQDQKALEQCGIDAVIKKHTNIRVNLVLLKGNYINAAIVPPGIDKNHPLYSSLERQRKNIDAAGREIVRVMKDNIGYVDLKTSKVYGFYEQVISMLGLYEGCFSIDNTNEEIAALILHELGHVFSYFEYLGTVVTTNYALSTTAQACIGMPELDRRITLLDGVANDLGVKVDVADLATTNDPNVIQIVLSNALLTKVRGELGANIYDLTGWEYLSDQFAVRHGAGRALVTILDKANRERGPLGYNNNSMYLTMEALKLGLFIGSNLLTGGFVSVFFILIGICFNPLSDLYDRPRDRTIRIKEQIIEALKDRSISKEHRKRLVDDINAIEVIEKTITSRRTLFQFIFTSIIPVHRKQWKQMVLQKELESLSNNAIFVSAAKLQNVIS